MEEEQWLDKEVEEELRAGLLIGSFLQARVSIFEVRLFSISTNLYLLNSVKAP